MLMSNKMLLASTSLIMPGDPDVMNGGYRAYNNFGDGLLYNINVAPKSTEVSRTWANSGATLLGALSRLNGPDMTDLATAGTTANSAQLYAKSISLGGLPCYLGAVDELAAVASKLRPSVSGSPLFQTGGSEVFTNAASWASTEESASTASAANMNTGLIIPNNVKTASLLVRPIRRFAAPMPFPIGTAMEGGYLAAYFTDLSSGAPLTYMLIVADKATEVSRVYQSPQTTLGGIYLSRTNGSAPTEANGASTGAAAMNYCFNLTSGAKTDWYLPAEDELLTVIRMNSSLPVGQQFTASSNYWSSTEVDNNFAKWVVTSASTIGTEQATGKNTSSPVRPIRRVLLP